MFHVFEILMPWADDSREVFRQVAGFIARVLAGAPPRPRSTCWRRSGSAGRTGRPAQPVGRLAEVPTEVRMGDVGQQVRALAHGDGR